MEEENWLAEPRPDPVAQESWIALEYAWLLVPLLILTLVGLSYYRAHCRRRAFHQLPADRREILFKALLFVIHNGAIEKGQIARGPHRKPANVLGELLTLNAHTVDEGLRRLIERGHLAGVCGSSAWRLTTHIESTPKGCLFHEEHFGSAGGVLDLAAFGLTILSSRAPDFPTPPKGILILPSSEEKR